MVLHARVAATSNALYLAAICCGHDGPGVNADVLVGCGKIDAGLGRCGGRYHAGCRLCRRGRCQLAERWVNTLVVDRYAVPLL